MNEETLDAGVVYSSASTKLNYLVLPAVIVIDSNTVTWCFEDQFKAFRTDKIHTIARAITDLNVVAPLYVIKVHVH